MNAQTQQFDLTDSDRAFLNGESSTPDAQKSKALTLPQRAAVAVGTAKVENELVELSTKYADITEIKNVDGRMQCHAAYMSLKNARTSIQAAASDARDDANKFSKAVIAEENRLIAITKKEEERLKDLRDKFDADEEAKRQAAIAAERNRIANIKNEIETIRRYPVDAAGKTVAEIGLMQVALANIVIDDSYAEFFNEAAAIHALSTVKLNELHAAAVAHEEEVKRMAAEREELARLRAEQAARAAEQERQAKAAQEEQERAARIQREAKEAALQVERDQLAAERAEIDRQKAEVEAAHAKLLARLAESQQIEDARQAELAGAVLQHRMADPSLEETQKALRDAVTIGTGVSLVTENGIKHVPVESIAAPSAPPRLVTPSVLEALRKQIVRPSDEEIIAAVALHFDVPNDIANEWLREFQAVAA